MTEQPKDGGAAFDLAQMIADREAGTPGDKWVRMSTPARNPDWINADVRRENRVPAMEAEIIRLTARVAELEGALKPLADMAERYDPDDGDDGQLECWSGLAVPKIHHLRTARAALSTHTEEPKT